MSTQKNLTSLYINKVDSRSTYNKMKQQGLTQDGQLYLVEEEVSIDNIPELQETLDNKVDKVSGKGLSTNDYNATEKSHVQTAYEHSQATHAPSNAEANQNAYSNIKVGTTTVSAKSTTDTITLEAGDNVTLTPDATNKKVTIKATNTVYSHPTHTAKTNGFYKVTVDSLGHVSDTTAVSKSDITALGIPSQDTVYEEASSSSAGIMKLYTSTGTNTDGTMTQSAIKSALDGKAASSHGHSASDITSGTLSIARGGTGATTVADARTNLNVYSKDETDTKLGKKANLKHKHIVSDVVDLGVVEGTGYTYDDNGVTANGTQAVIDIASGGTGAITASGALANLGALPVQDLSVNTTAPGTANYGRTLTVTSASSDKYYIGIDEYGKLWGGQATNNASSITWYPAIMNNSNNGKVSITASSFEINNATLYVHSSAIWAPWLSLKSGNTMYFYPNDQTELYAWMDKQTTGVRFCPQADAKGAIGHNNYRWNSIYSSNGTIQTSDRRKKKDISDDISVYKDILSEITPVRYRYNDIEGDKIRIGFIAQDLDSLFEKHGLDPRDFAAIRLDDVDPTDIIPDGKVYGLSYEGFVALNTALIQDLQKENAKLKSRLSALEEKLEDSNVG